MTAQERPGAGAGVALYLTEAQAAAYNARRGRDAAGGVTPNSGGVAHLPPDGEGSRPYLYFIQSGGRTIVVLNAATEQWRMPEEEMHDMALEAGEKVHKKQQPRTDATNASLRNYWGDYLQSVWDRRNGRVSFGPATFTNRRWRELAR